MIGPALLTFVGLFSPQMGIERHLNQDLPLQRGVVA